MEVIRPFSRPRSPRPQMNKAAPAHQARDDRDNYATHDPCQPRGPAPDDRGQGRGRGERAGPSAEGCPGPAGAEEKGDQDKNRRNTVQNLKHGGGELTTALGIPQSVQASIESDPGRRAHDQRDDDKTNRLSKGHSRGHHVIAIAAIRSPK